MGAEVLSKTAPVLPLAATLERPRKRIAGEDCDFDSDAADDAEDEDGASSISSSGCEPDFQFHENENVEIHNGKNERDCQRQSMAKRREDRRQLSSDKLNLHQIMNAIAFVLIPLMASFFYRNGLFLSLESDAFGFNVSSVKSNLATMLNQLYQHYVGMLERRPVLTKSLTAGVIQFLGDCGAQWYEGKHNREGDVKKERKHDLQFDFRRSVSLFIDGLCVSGPVLHYCFGYMEQIWPTSAEDDGRLLATLCHVFFNDYIIDSSYIAFSFVFTGLVEGYSWPEIRENIRKDLWATVRASWLTSIGLIPVEIFCFGYLSLSFRVLAMNIVDLFWGAVVSFYSHRSRRK